MLIGISVTLILAATVAAAIFKLARRQFSLTGLDEKGLSTLEWILLVAAVGGLATAGVIIVRNAVGSAGDDVEGGERLEAIAQEEVDEAMRRTEGSKSSPVTTLEAVAAHAAAPAINATDIRKRCDINFFYWGGSPTDEIFPLRKWRGQFIMKYVEATAGTGTAKAINPWCDAVPTSGDNEPLGTESPRGPTYDFES